VLVMEFAQAGAVIQVGIASWGGQARVQVGCCKFLVSIFWWSKPPHHVKVNPLGEDDKLKNLPHFHVLGTSRLSWMVRWMDGLCHQLGLNTFILKCCP
jgi:hypothetical protein